MSTWHPPGHWDWFSDVLHGSKQASENATEFARKSQERGSPIPLMPLSWWKKNLDLPVAIALSGGPCLRIKQRTGKQSHGVVRQLATTWTPGPYLRRSQYTPRFPIMRSRNVFFYLHQFELGFPLFITEIPRRHWECLKLGDPRKERSQWMRKKRGHQKEKENHPDITETKKGKSLRRDCHQQCQMPQGGGRQGYRFQSQSWATVWDIPTTDPKTVTEIYTPFVREVIQGNSSREERSQGRERSPYRMRFKRATTLGNWILILMGNSRKHKPQRYLSTNSHRYWLRAAPRGEAIKPLPLELPISIPFCTRTEWAQGQRKPSGKQTLVMPGWESGQNAITWKDMGPWLTTNSAFYPHLTVLICKVGEVA